MKLKNNFFHISIIILLLIFSSFNSVFAKDIINYKGNYTSSFDYSDVKINPYQKNKYIITIFLYRLALFENIIGNCKNNIIYFKTENYDGNDLYGTFKQNGKDYVLEITKSTWEYLPVGTKYTFSKT